MNIDELGCLFIGHEWKFCIVRLYSHDADIRICHRCLRREISVQVGADKEEEAIMIWVKWRTK